MAKLSKNRAKAEALLDRTRKYSVEEAVAIVKKAKYTKFDEILGFLQAKSGDLAHHLDDVDLVRA